MQFEERLCFLKGAITTDNRDNLLKYLADRLQKCGYVKEGFLQSILKREEEYPTGLALYNAAYHIAIPHSDPEFVNEDAAAVALLEHPVIFQRMDDRDESVEVSLVIMLAIRDAEEHMHMLASVIHTLQDRKKAEQLMRMESATKLIAFVKNMMEENEYVSE